MKLALLILPLLFLGTKSAKILAISPAPGYSQFILSEVLLTELARKGHEITVISPHQPKNPIKNYRTIVTENTMKKFKDLNYFWSVYSNMFTKMLRTYKFGTTITLETFENKEVQKLINSNEQFDVVILETFCNEAMKGFATHFGAPLISFNTMPLAQWNKEYMGVPILPSISAVSHTNYINEMSFLQRLHNVILTIGDYLYRNWVYYPQHKRFLEKYFPKPMNFYEIINNASVMLLNQHSSIAENMLLPQNIIEIGGFHVKEPTLDTATEEYLNNATDGAILFSLGSNLKSSQLSPEIQAAFLKTFGKLKQKVLWKFETDLDMKPKNVLISKWLNQQAILTHPNLQLFITHGGLLSVTESIFNDVPMLGIPVFADQRQNIARAQNKGIAEVLEFGDLSEETVSTQLNKMLNDPKYKINAKKMSAVLKDRPIHPLDLATYWVEYVIRHKGLRFELPTYKLFWFQIYSLDVMIFGIFSVFIFYVIVKIAIRWCRKNTTKKIKNQ